MWGTMTRLIAEGRNSLYIEGYKSIICCDSNILKLGCRKNTLSVYGKNLCLDTYPDDQLHLSGTIEKICWE